MKAQNSLVSLDFTFGEVMTRGLKTEVFRHTKPFRELKIRFTKGLQLPATGYDFLVCNTLGSYA